MAFSIPEKIEVMDDAMADILRQKTERERLEIAFGMWRFARDMIRANAEADHPEWTEGEIRRYVASRMSHGAV